ncbi:hypothetical protein GCM10027020_23260 [Nocardioides salsibiostraticola]
MSRQPVPLPDALELIAKEENQLWDHKSSTGGGDTIQKIAVALANADGGQFSVGIEDEKHHAGIDRWQGFTTIEDANFVHQSLSREVSPALDYEYDFFEISGQEQRGLVMVVTVPRSGDVHYTSAKKCYLRVSASSPEVKGRSVADLQLSKGVLSYEDQRLSDYDFNEWAVEPELLNFLSEYSPKSTPEFLASRERLSDRDSQQMKVAAAVLFAAHPSGVVPKRCGIKIARYATAGEPTRQNLDGAPLTITGPARQLVEEAIREATAIINSVSVLEPDGSFAPMEYPPEALKEIVVNAVIHRDYNISDDVRIAIFDNRVEVRSPGGLAGHMTLDLLFKERAARNTKILRLLNGYATPLNQDIGEGLTTVVESMAAARLREPRFAIDGNAFVAVLPHERLARPEEIVMEYLVTHDEITNRIARGLTGITSENTMKEVFYNLRDTNKIERVPGKNGNKAAWMKAGQPVTP